MTVFVHDLLRPQAPVALAPTNAPRWRWLFAALLLAAVVYLPAALGAQLLDFDDNFFFGPDHQPFRDGGLSAVFDPSQPIANAFLPVAHLSLYLDYAWTGSQPFWPHLHALLLHGLVGFVVARLWLRLGAGVLVAHAAAALFVVHPALAESVAWVSGRKDLLSGLFTFAVLHQVAAHAQDGRRWRLLLILLGTAAAMYSKATAIVLPLLAVLVVLRTGGPARRWLGPSLALLTALPIAWHHQQIAAAEGTLAAGSLLARLGQVPGAFWHYLRTAGWPFELNVLYPELATLARFRADWQAGTLALAAVGVVAALAIRWRPLRPVRFGLLGFVLALLPFNTAFPASSIAAADRYLYLAVPFFAAAVAAVAVALWPRRGGWLLVPLLLVTAFLGGRRAHDFADTGTLWQRSIAVEPVNAVAQLNLVYDRLQRGATPADLRPHLQQAVAAASYPIHTLRAQQLLVQLAQLDGDDGAAAAAARAAIAAANAQLELETAPKRRAEATTWLLQAHLAGFDPLRRSGDADGAAKSLQALRELAPADPQVIAFGAMLELDACGPELRALAAAGQSPRLRPDDPRGEAVDRRLAAARAAHPDHPGLVLAQAEWDRARDKVFAAMRYFKQATQLAPQRTEGWLGAARLMRERENFEDAARFARDGLQHRPTDPGLRQELALALVGGGQLDEAELQLQAYLKTRPDDRDTGRVLANVLTVRAFARLADRNADRAQVRRAIEQALVWNPDEPRAQLVLGRLAREERRTADAVRHFELAWQRLPTIEEARQGLVESLAALGYERLLQRDDAGAVTAWLRCVEVAPADFEVDEIRQQLQRAWGRFEAAGVEQLRLGNKAAAAQAFRRCLQIQPEHHWPAWLLATALYEDPAADPAEVERLCGQGVAWQQRYGLDRSRQVLLLATVQQKAGRPAAAKTTAADYLQAPDADANPQVLAALRRLAAD
ncbi:MAG: tetratricopeptide repeat protein [Planctomycetes bacterium]|nr:tetratricopeptide repeat protein [Planctomycetota bacterium]